ncbi:hypothetical protein HELRODRAFT_183379 [Helobdella robusta]|uniref:Uncharacterized protein n=1 Tax=Helobdella robusta TaxID=6412 RepID=T1FJJ2_HELRO|nr:hypothetical protein HELRODRAFT_183379 [Helobdella robusta]ESO11276.1 hypothetical protein HELRODRAFT_183379 [Helobdella robusta]
MAETKEQKTRKAHGLSKSFSTDVHSTTMTSSSSPTSSSTTTPLNFQRNKHYFTSRVADNDDVISGSFKNRDVRNKLKKSSRHHQRCSSNYNNHNKIIGYNSHNSSNNFRNDSTKHNCFSNNRNISSNVVNKSCSNIACNIRQHLIAHILRAVWMPQNQLC